MSFVIFHLDRMSRPMLFNSAVNAAIFDFEGRFIKRRLIRRFTAFVLFCIRECLRRRQTGIVLRPHYFTHGKVHRMTDFSGTVTFITGTSSGIGRALALEIARRGGDVILAARRLDRITILAEEIEALGQQSLAVSCDVTQDGDLEAAVELAQKKFGHIDYVVANAGFGVAGRFEKLTLEDYRRQFETNVFGVIRTIQATRSSLITSRGCIALIGSVNGYIATPRLSAYAMSKYAVHGLADSLRHELREYGVAVTLIVPGFIETEVRKVDKHGVYHAEIKDRIPKWLRMPADRAARTIAQALLHRNRQKIITIHAALLILLQRYFPSLVNIIIAHSGGRKHRG